MIKQGDFCNNVILALKYGIVHVVTVLWAGLLD